MSAEYQALPFDLPTLTSPLLVEEPGQRPTLRVVGGTAKELIAQPVTVIGRLTVSF